ncbi:MAG: peptidase C25 [Thermoplasmatales archaeon]|nr:MAG: peptidase C25 [Thermoplasmatales archaeon]
MKKIITLIIIAILGLNGLAVVAIPKDNLNLIEKTETITFSKPMINEHTRFSIVNIENANSWLKNPGLPLLPAYVKTYNFPFGTRIKDVDVTFSEPEEYSLEKNIVSAPSPVTLVTGKKIHASQVDINSYEGVYPEKQYFYNIGSGLYRDEHVILLTVQCCPVQYIPVESKILYHNEVHIKISYELSSNPTTFGNNYDMVIIAPEVFSKNLQPLINHKMEHNVTTFLKTVEGIYNEYEGFDQPEKIKYYIKYAIETDGVDYVLLVGGMRGQWPKWHIPVRYSHLDDNSNFESSYISDLYYADIYDKYGNFSSWDTNGNEIFAEWNSEGKDIIDMCPDVYVGRLPCRNNLEVKIMVDKIIKYENTAYEKEWFKNMVVVGGDSAPGYTYYEGEEENKKALEYMPGFKGIKLWTSTGNLTGVDDVVDAISDGCGFLFFDGHGNPSTWSTHPPDNETWITGLSLKDMPKLMNRIKLPVSVVGGCHNAQFNVTMFNLIEGILKQGLLGYFSTTPPIGDYWKREWVPECWAWRLVRKIGGGAIAIMGYTGLDWFAEGDYDNDSIPDCVQYFSGFANTNFFKNYGINNFTKLGKAHTQTLNDYLNQFPIDWNTTWGDPEQSATLLDCKTIQEFALLGDPSLQIGGYS